ncbi:metalloregulator ArsR/SmtB family transcription factor [Colwellia ponticola]|uniref:Metalloregulator ArsR/SmtB family transcription factor n=1 Tax=Colwellia ponticola TaxID=2304625 RepID=A0A8H2PKF5_9GAMM|nr:metalloregulator ArsR/SmtB family transcription factor [Colwellia ponticola]TMM45051.1 metalloregulator ArsR/SmtB family transcription factor [Colwellia ponticola]
MNSIKKQKVLFLCTGNSARSQIAEALLRHKASEKFEVFSAGTHPENIDLRAIAALNQLAIDTKNLTSKSISVFAGQAFDYVITLCSKANEECRSYPNTAKQLNWDLVDPKTRADKQAFTATVTELNNRLSMFLLAEGAPVTIANKVAITHSEANQTLTNFSPIIFYKSLSDDIRLKVLMLTHYHGELCVCELMTALNEDSQPKVSRNLAVLKKARVLIDRKHGQWVFYRINPMLPLWAKSVIAQTTENNILLINQPLKRLDKMKNRPEKTDFCK